MKRLTISRRVGVAIVAIFLALVTAFGVTTRANARTITGTSVSCPYRISNDSQRTSSSVTQGADCEWTTAYIQYRSAAGTLYTDHGATGWSSTTAQYGSPLTITSNYAAVKSSHGGVGAINIYV
jgi:hypothetical protein